MPADERRAAPIPVVLNRGGGSADALRDALSDDPRFALDEVEGSDVAAAVARALDGGAPRIAVAGGDGTVVTAARVLVARGMARAVELAVLPAGTLNHFAGHLGIPSEPAAALALAADGVPRDVDAAFVGDLAFVNTSTVGAYVAFVRLRERLERHLGYRLASLLAGLRLFLALPAYRVELEVEGHARTYETPLVFVGVGERSVATPALAARVASGRPGLHVIVVRGRRRARLLALGLAAARGGAPAVSRMPEVDSFLVERCRVSVPVARPHVSTDGELHRLPAPLDYRSAHRLLRVVAPPEPPRAAPAG